jgi:2-polyprenyl-3-methyl-5-hydroxy-6-metoxy-1,4-benzoquinol methylase
LSEQYNPQQYWQKRLQENFNLRGVGNIGFSQSYNGWQYRRKAQVIKKIFHNTNLDKLEVLDVGCGTGFFTQWYLHRGAKIVGIDIAEKSVETLSSQFPGTFRMQDIASAEYEPLRLFDIVNMWDVIYHIVDDCAYERALDNISASLKPGGLFIFSDFLGRPSDTLIAAHVKARCLETHRRALVKRGLTFKAVYPVYSLLNVPHFGRFDNLLGGLYFALDAFQQRPATSNLSVGVWVNDPKGVGSHSN